MVVALLTMPTTIRKRDSNLSMQDTTQSGKDDSEQNHYKRMRSMYNTDDLGAIMGRFFEAVSWRNN